VLAGVVLASTAAHADDPTVDPSSVLYQNKPKDGQQRSGCLSFVAPNACKVVFGTINPGGWCAVFQPKA